MTMYIMSSQSGKFSMSRRSPLQEQRIVFTAIIEERKRYELNAHAAFITSLVAPSSRTLRTTPRTDATILSAQS